MVTNVRWFPAADTTPQCDKLRNLTMKTQSDLRTTRFGKRTGRRNRHSSRRQPGRFVVESLERRELMAANLAADTGLTFEMIRAEATRPAAVTAPHRPSTRAQMGLLPLRSWPK